MKNDDFGYFGKGLTGYAHYTQTFNSCFGKSNASASCTKHRTAPSAAQNKTQENIDLCNEMRTQEHKHTVKEKPNIASLIIIALAAMGLLGFLIGAFATAESTGAAFGMIGVLAVILGGAALIGWFLF